MSKIVPVRAILPILVIFRMSPTSKAITKPEVSKARAAIQALKKVRKTNRQLPRPLGTPPRVSRWSSGTSRRTGGTLSARWEGGRPKSVVMAENIKKARELARKNPVRNIHEVATACACSKTSARCIVKAAGLKSLATLLKPLLSTVAKAKRVERCQKLQK